MPKVIEILLRIERLKDRIETYLNVAIDTPCYSVSPM